MKKHFLEDLILKKYSFNPNPKPRRFLSPDKEFRFIYEKLKHSGAKISELVALRVDRDAILYYVSIGLLSCDNASQITLTLSGRAYFKQRCIENKRAIFTGVISVLLAVIASVCASLTALFLTIR